MVAVAGVCTRLCGAVVNVTLKLMTMENKNCTKSDKEWKNESCGRQERNSTSCGYKKFDEVKDKVGEKAEHFKHDVQEKSTELKNRMSENASHIKHTVQEKAAEIKDRVGEKVGEYKDIAKDKIADAADKVKDAVKRS